MLLQILPIPANDEKGCYDIPEQQSMNEYIPEQDHASRAKKCRKEVVCQQCMKDNEKERYTVKTIRPLPPYFLRSQHPRIEIENLGQNKIQSGVDGMDRWV